MSYKLINPVIEGKFSSTFTGKTDLDAAEKAWSALSKYFSNNVPKFAFTMEGGNGTLYHYLVEENKDGHDVTYNISHLNLTKTKAQETSLKKKLGALRRQHGGEKDEEKHEEKKHKREKEKSSSSSSSSSSSEGFGHRDKMYNNMRFNSRSYYNPFTYWGYIPMIYESLQSFYMPVFIPSLMPYVEIFTTTNWWGY